MKEITEKELDKTYQQCPQTKQTIMLEYKGKNRGLIKLS